VVAKAEVKLKKDSTSCKRIRVFLKKFYQDLISMIIYLANFYINSSYFIIRFNKDIWTFEKDTY